MKAIVGETEIFEICKLTEDNATSFKNRKGGDEQFASRQGVKGDEVSGGS